MALAGAAPALIGTVATAQEPGEAEAKLREALRAVTLQVRTVAGERDVAVAEKVTLEARKAELEAQVKQLIADRESLEKTAATLKEKLAASEEDGASLKGSLQRSENNFKLASEVAAQKEAERAKLADQVKRLEVAIADREGKNGELYKLGNEILNRYKQHALGDAILAKEPFVGITRVKLDRLAQKYETRLYENRVRP